MAKHCFFILPLILFSCQDQALVLSSPELTALISETTAVSFGWDPAFPTGEGQNPDEDSLFYLPVVLSEDEMIAQQNSPSNDFLQEKGLQNTNWQPALTSHWEDFLLPDTLYFGFVLVRKEQGPISQYHPIQISTLSAQPISEAAEAEQEEVNLDSSLPAQLSLPDEYKEMSAEELNSRGMDYYDEKDWGRAEEFFRYAHLQNPRFPLAPYNLACVLSLKHSPEIDQIIQYLHFSYKNSSGRLQRIMVDSDLDYLRTKDAFQGFMNHVGTRPFDILASNYPDSYFQWENDFFYQEKLELLVDLAGDKPGAFISLSSLQTLDLGASTQLVIYDIFYPESGDWRDFRGMGEENPSVFGYIEGEKALGVLFYDSDSGEILAKSQLENWRPVQDSSVSSLERVVGSPTSVAITSSNFSSGSFYELRILHLSPWGDVYVSDPLITQSEDLSGGVAPLREYKNLRFSEGLVEIDLHIDGVYVETREIMDLRY